MDVHLRYEELAANQNVEYIAGGNALNVYYCGFDMIVLYLPCVVNIIPDKVYSIIFFAGATQNSIKVAQVHLRILSGGF